MNVAATPPVFETLLLTLEDGVAEVTLNRPDSANAMSAQLWQELEQCFRWLDGATAVRCVVLAGAGRHFCAGMDLSVFADVATQPGADAARRAESLRGVILGFQRALTVIEECRKPVLAAIHGACLGGGMAMIACCDMRYASHDARFSIREINLGMTADVGSLQRLPLLMPRGLVHELAYTGRDLSAREAQACGLVNALFADSAALLQHVRELAATIATKSPLAVRGTKRVLLHARDHTVAEGLDYVATWNAGLLSADDLQAALLARQSGKPPQFGD